MLRSFLMGVAAVTLVACAVVLLPQANPPDPHVRLADRASTSQQAPGSNLEGLAVYAPVVDYVAAVERNKITAYLTALHDQQVAEQNAEVVPPDPAQQSGATSAPPSGTGACASGGGYDAVAGYIIDRESGGDYCVKNPSSSACGKYQILDTTWNMFGGYASACDAPPSVQDEKAASMNPCHWNPPQYCAG